MLGKVHILQKFCAGGGFSFIMGLKKICHKKRILKTEYSTMQYTKLPTSFFEVYSFYFK
jgi:hypothetical protein